MVTTNRQIISSRFCYSPSYLRAVTKSPFSSFKSFSCYFLEQKAWIRTWVVATSINGTLTDLSQLLFAPTRYGQSLGNVGNIRRLVRCDADLDGLTILA